MNERDKAPMAEELKKLLAKYNYVPGDVAIRLAKAAYRLGMAHAKRRGLKEQA